MIHTIYSLTVHTYLELSDTENYDLLKRWYNPFPVKWFDTEKFFDEIKRIFPNDSNGKANDQKYQIIAYNKIKALDAMIQTTLLLMKNSNDRTLFAIMLKKDPKTYEGNLQYYIDTIKQMTGIEVKDGDDLIKVQKETQRLIDKYQERYPKPKEGDKKQETSFADIVSGVLMTLGMQYSTSMSMYEFSNLRKRADKLNEPKT